MGQVLGALGFLPTLAWTWEELLGCPTGGPGTERTCLWPPCLLFLSTGSWQCYRSESCSHPSLERLHQCGSEAERGSLTSEVPEGHKSVTPQMKSIRWKTAGVIHYLSLCNKQMSCRLLWSICFVALLHWLPPKTASEGKGKTHIAYFIP